MDINNNINSELRLIDRKNLTLTGIKKIKSFDKENFILESNLGNINIKGKNLELIKLDTIDGILKISGLVNSILYLDLKDKMKEESFISKLFK